MKLNLLLLLLVLMGSTVGAQESTYFIGPVEGVACDGHSPECPLTLSQAQTLHLFEGNSRRIEFRKGTYSLPEGLVVNGTGTNDRSRLILAVYHGETVIFDGLALDASATGPREVVRVSGAYVTIQGIQIQNSRGYNLEVRGARMVNLIGNYFFRNVASDSLKLDGGAKDVNIIANTFMEWDSQAIDIAGAQRVLVQHNLIFNSTGEKATAIGVKMGSADIRVYDNEIRNSGGVQGGGTSDHHPESYEAYDVWFMRNHFANIRGKAVEFYSCNGCRAEDNLIDGAWAGIWLRGGASGCEGGCKPSLRITVAGNKLRRMDGGPEVGAPKDMMAIVESSEIGAATFSRNTYCISNVAAFFHGTLLDWAGWKQVMPSDAKSVVVGNCQ